MYRPREEEKSGSNFERDLDLDPGTIQGWIRECFTDAAVSNTTLNCHSPVVGNSVAV